MKRINKIHEKDY